MRINFKKIQLKNFMSFSKQSFDISACSGMNLVQGKNNDIPGSKNGSGKSSLFAALLYVLFGQLQTKIKNENLANKFIDDKDMDLALLFDVDGEEYKIQRGLVKGKSSYLELFKTQDGKEVNITKSTIPETQQFIEKELIHCDVSIFLRTMLLTADQSYSFYMLKKADKKDFIDKLFDISMFESMYKLIHKDVLVLEKESLACQNQMMVLNKNHDDYNARLAAFEQSRNARLKILQDGIAQLQKKLEATKQVEVKSNTQVIAKLEDALEKLRSQYDTCAQGVLALQSEDGKIDVSLHKLNESKASRQSIIGKHRDILHKLCANCKKVFMTHYSIDKMLVEIKELDSKSKALESAKSSKQAQIEDSKKKMADFRQKMSKAQSKLKELSEQSSRASRDLQQVQSQLDEQTRDFNKELRSTNPYADLIQKSKKEINEGTKKLSKIEEKSKYLSFAESIVSQETIRKFIVKDLVVLLNNKIKTYLTKLGAKYYVEFNEDMDYNFVTSRGTYEWSNFSAGERMRIMIATSFAFRDFMSIRNGLNSNILVLDEYFDSAIDSLCVENIISILKDFSAKQNQNIFVISHRPEVSTEQFDNIILVEKTDNIAEVHVLPT